MEKSLKSGTWASFILHLSCGSAANLATPGIPHKRYYAFVRGKHIGILFDVWNNVQDFGKGINKPLYRGFDSFEEAKNFMAENGLYINQVQTRCKVTNNQLDQQVTSEPDVIITSSHNENTQDCTLNSVNDLDTEGRHEEDFDTTCSTNLPAATSNHENRKTDDIFGRSFELTRETCENTEDTMSPIPKRSAEFNSQIRNETDNDKVEKLREYFKEELSKIWVTLSSLLLHAGQSGRTCDTQKELFDFIKEERESSRILWRENLTLAGENIDLREKVLSQQQQLESLTLANRLLQ